MLAKIFLEPVNIAAALGLAIGLTPATEFTPAPRDLFVTGARPRHTGVSVLDLNALLPWQLLQISSEVITYKFSDAIQ